MYLRHIPLKGKKMDKFEIWLHFCKLIHDDFLISHPDLISGYREIFSGFTKNQQDILHEFFLEVKEYSLEEKFELWRSAGSPFGANFHTTDAAVLFFDNIFDTLEEVRSEENYWVPKSERLK